MCDFDLERRRKDLGANPRTGTDRRNGETMFGTDAETRRPRNTKYLLDWVVRVLIIILTIIATATFSHVRAISDRSHELEIRVTSIESSRFTSEDGLALWRALNQYPTRVEISGDLADIKQMIRDLRAEINSR